MEHTDTMEERLDQQDGEPENEVDVTEEQGQQPTELEAIEDTETGAASDESDVLEQELAQEKEKAEEYLDQWRRTAAEFANYKKRSDKERASLTKTGNAALIMKLLPALDDFELAENAIPPELRDLSWVEGITLIGTKLQQILEQEGLSLIEAEGEPFDPNVHEAVVYQPSSEHEEGIVIEQLRRGYTFHDQVLRPTLVIVAQGVRQAK